MDLEMTDEELEETLFRILPTLVRTVELHDGHVPEHWTVRELIDRFREITGK